MPYIGGQVNNIKQNIGVYTPSEILQLTKDGHWGGSLELIQEQTYSSAVSSVQFTDIQEGVYDTHLLQMENVQATNDATNYFIYFFEDGVGWETAGVYNNARSIMATNNTSSEQRSTSTAGISIFGTNDNDTNHKNNGYIYFYDLGKSDRYNFSTFQTFGNDFYEKGSHVGSALLPQVSKVTGIRIDINAGNFSSFTLKLYGIKKV